jgi:hypothetical protein
LEKLGVLGTPSGTDQRLIVPNYINSQSMCLSTASFYTVCCPNECESLLANLERSIAAPVGEVAALARLFAAFPNPPTEALLQELPGFADPVSGLVPLHGLALAGWMHRAFPTQCPAPHSQKVTNPMTPDEWMAESGREVAALEEMMSEIAQVLARYTTMGKEFGKEYFRKEESVPDVNADIVRIRAHKPQERALMKASGHYVLSTIFHVGALLSMMGLVALGISSGRQVTSSGKDKFSFPKDFV